MFRTMGGASGIFFISFILHVSSSPAAGFRIAFISVAVALLCVLPLVFIIPDGKGGWAERAAEA
jgi:hypothetical protein